MMLCVGLMGESGAESEHDIPDSVFIGVSFRYLRLNLSRPRSERPLWDGAAAFLQCP